MKRLIICSILFLSLSSVVKTTDTVYYCDSPNGKKYHFKKECRGLQKCTHKIVKTTVSDAKKLDLTICLIEK